MTMFEVMLTKDEVCKMLNCTPCIVDSLRKKEGLPYIKMGHAVRFSQSEVLNWIESKKVVGMPTQKRR